MWMCMQEMSKLLPSAALVEHALMTVLLSSWFQILICSRLVYQNARIIRGGREGEREGEILGGWGQDKRQLPCFVNCAYLHLSWQFQTQCRPNITMAILNSEGKFLGCCCGRGWVEQYFTVFVMQLMIELCLYLGCHTAMKTCSVADEPSAYHNVYSLQK